MARITKSKMTAKKAFIRRAVRRNPRLSLNELQRRVTKKFKQSIGRRTLRYTVSIALYGSV